MESLISFVRNYAANGSGNAIRQPHGYRTEGWTYARIVQEANRLARVLETQGIVKGDAVLLWAENSAEWIVAFFGCLLCGAVIVPIDSSSTPAFASRVAKEVKAKFLLRTRAHSGEFQIPSIFLETLPQVTAAHDCSPYASPVLSRQDPLEIIFTSGTTAEPRGVVISHGNFLANLEPLETEIRKYRKYEKFFHPLRFLNLLPLSHVFGQMLGVFIPSILAATVVFPDSHKTRDLIHAIRRERISVCVAVPRFIESLQREVERQEVRNGKFEQFQSNFDRAADEHFLRRWWRFRGVHSRLGWKFWAFISGGAALPEHAETFWNRLGYAVIQGYGMTETTSLISLNHPFRSAKGSMGSVFPGTEVRIAENGEVLVRGENVARTYLQDGQAQPVAAEDGWFRTGDLANRDERGRLYFKGRRKNVIVTSSGMNVYPEDLEKALREQPGVRDCVVIGLERDRNAEPYAILLMDNGGSDAVAADAVERANQKLAEYQKIHRWFRWSEPDFPRTPTHKPILPRIREAALASVGVTPASTQNDSITGLIERITGRPVPQNSTNGNLEVDLQLSSLDRVELMSALEDRYQVELNEIPFANAETVGQLEKLLTRNTASAIEHVYPTWPQHWISTAFRLTIYYLFAWPATYLLAAPRIRGRKTLSELRGPVLVVSNHVTYLDIAWVLPALPARFRNRLATAMRGERLAEMRRPSQTLSLFQRLMERLRYFLVSELFNVFPLPKQSGFLQSFHFAGELVDRDWNILIFPEGLTSEDGKMSSFRAGIGLLAKQLNIPVVPIHLDGLFDLKKENRRIARPGHVRVSVGTPVRYSPDQDPNEITRDLERRVRELQFI
jgi:long-chain acyl-CoA synthetase